MRAALRLAALLGLACASPQPYAVERCPSPKQLPPRPSTQCKAGPETVAYEDRLAALLTSAAGPLALRVALDGRSRVAAICAEGTSRGMENARARRTLAANLGDVWALPPGPACLAGTRIDLDGRRAKLALIERTDLQCRQEMRGTGGAPLGSGTRSNPSAIDRAIAPNACIGARLAWLFAEKRGTWWRLFALAPANTTALLFAPIEGAQPPATAASLVATACAKLSERSELLACMQEEGWELLE
jgi:hypothetical protein